MKILHTDNTIKIAAHRGYAAAYPENTLAAVKAAVDVGVMAVEVDVQFSEDGVAVLLHDTDFKRVANINKSVFETSIADIKNIVINEKEKFSNKFDDNYSCTLFEFAEFVEKTGDLIAFVEIKHESVERFGALYVVEQLEKILGRVKRQCIIISYSNDFLKTVRLQSGFEVGYIFTLWDKQNLLNAEKLLPEFVICNHTKIPDNINFRDFPWQWLLYEITDCVQLDYYFRQGVQWVESMDPKRLMDCLNDNSNSHG